jgi:hypothetical protein
MIKNIVFNTIIFIGFIGFIRFIGFLKADHTIPHFAHVALFCALQHSLSVGQSGPNDITGKTRVRK